MKRVAVDTTVMEKAIAHPTDARLYERARDQLVALALVVGIHPVKAAAKSGLTVAFDGDHLK